VVYVDAKHAVANSTNGWEFKFIRDRSGLYLLSPSEYERFTLSARNSVEAISRVTTNRHEETKIENAFQQLTVQAVVEDEAPTALVSNVACICAALVKGGYVCVLRW